jgi:hypothetical protein
VQDHRSVGSLQVQEPTRLTKGIWSRFRAMSGLTWVAVFSSLVLLLNFIFALVVQLALRTRINDDLPSYNPGSCDKVSQMSRGLHYLINIICTLLLAASNYYMQYLSACTRKEIDFAHNKGSWVDVGIPSIRNIRFMSKGRIALWLILALSSIPLHLLYVIFILTTIHFAWSLTDRLHRYNSVIIETTGANMYSVGATSTTFLESDPKLLTSKMDISNYQNISASECVRTYSNSRYVGPSGQDISYLETGGSVIAVTAATDQNADSLFVYGAMGSNIIDTHNFTNLISIFGAPLGKGWVCLDHIHNTDQDVAKQVTRFDSCNITSLETDTAWTIQGYPISYCLADQQPSRCELQFSFTILWVVVCCNALKVICMVIVIKRYQGNSLVTLGDVIASFLTNPYGVARKDVDTMRNSASFKEDNMLKPNKTSKRWIQSVSWRRWLLLCSV